MEVQREKIWQEKKTGGKRAGEDGGREKNQRCGAGIQGHVAGRKMLTSASIIFFLPSRICGLGCP